MQKRRWLHTGIAMTALAGLTAWSSLAVSAETVKSDMAVTWNGEAAAWADQAYLIDSSLYAPHEELAKQLGAESAWDAETGTLTLKKDESTLVMKTDAESITFDGLNVTTSTPLRTTGDTALAPVRLVTERLGHRINYDAETRTVHIVENGNLPVSIVADLDPDQSTGMRIEGIIGTADGQVFTIEMDSKQLIRVNPENGETKVLTVLPRTATGMALDADGNLYMASGSGDDGGAVLRVKAELLAGEPFDASEVETFVTGVTGANGLTFDAQGNLYVSGGATGMIYIISPDGTKRDWESGIQADREQQKITVNGVAFGSDGKLYVANTSSGEINRVILNDDGTLGTVERFATDAKLFGADGIAFAPNGDLYVGANERNAIVKVTPDGKVSDVSVNGNNGPLEFPASLHFIGNDLYISNFDVAREVNSPNTPGIGASVVKITVPAEEQTP